MSDFLVKFDGANAACTAAACGRDAAFSSFLANLTKNFMASDGSMEEAFKATKIEHAAQQFSASLPKLPVTNVSDANAQAVISTIQSGNGLSA
jgi:hypothetical protein